MLKSHEKKSQNYFRRIVKRRRNVSFKEIDTEPSTGKDDGFWLLWGIYPDNISTSDQRCFNVVDQRWNDVDPMLKMKQNSTSVSQRCTTLIQRRCPTLKHCWYNVVQRRISVVSTSYNVVSTLIITLYQRSFNVASTSFKPTIQVARMLV